MKTSWVKGFVPTRIKLVLVVFVCLLSVFFTFTQHYSESVAASDKEELQSLNADLQNKKEDFRKVAEFRRESKKKDLIETAKNRQEKLKKLIAENPREARAAIMDFNEDEFPEEARGYLEKKVEKKGFIGVLHEDSTDGGTKDTTLLFDNDKLMGEPKVLVSDEGDFEAKPNSEATVTGYEVGSYVLYSMGSSSVTAQALTYSGHVTGPRTMAVYYVSYVNAQHSNHSRSSISSYVNGTLNNFVNTSSGGRVSIVGNVFEPNMFTFNTTVPLNGKGECDITRLKIDLQPRLEANFIDPGAYTDNVIVVDGGYSCGIAGAHLGGTSWYFTNGLQAFSHEFGHNIGLHHASVYDCGDVVVKAGCPYNPENKAQEYGNFLDIMGASFAPVLSSQDFGGYAKDYLGWLAGDEVAYAGGSGIYTLYNIEDSAGPVTQPYKVLKVPTFAGGPTYYLQYHTYYDGAEGPSLELGSGELLHGRHTFLLDLTPGSNNSSYSSDFADGLFRDGREFYDPFNNIRIKQLSHSENSAVIEVIRGGPNTNGSSLQVTWNRPVGYASAVARKKDVNWSDQTYVVSRKCISDFYGCPTNFEVVWTGTSLGTNITLTEGFDYEYKVEIYTKRDGNENQADVYPWVDPTFINVNCSGDAVTCDKSVSWPGVTYRALLLKSVSPEIKACASQAGCQDDINLLANSNVTFRGLLAIDGATQLDAKILVNDKNGNTHLLTRVGGLGTPEDYWHSCTSSDFSCEIRTPSGIGPFVGTERILRSVKRDNPNGRVVNGPSNANATPAGSYLSVWGWSYVAEIYPASFGSCAGAGDACQRQDLGNSSESNLYFTFNGLAPSTDYAWKACVQTCDTANGDPVIRQGITRTAGIPSGTNFFPNDPLKHLETLGSLPYIGEYFDNEDFTNLKLTRGESNVAFTWGSGSPYSGIANTRYSARWTRTMTVPSGKYRFILNTNSGGKVYLDGQQIINTNASTATLVAKQLGIGERLVKVEYAHTEGNSRVQFRIHKTTECYDLSGDNVINVADLGILASATLQNLADKSAYDINGDGTLNVSDRGLIASKFGKTCPH